MISGKYPQGMKPQFIADTFTALLLEHRLKGSSKENKDRKYGPYSKDDNRWQLDHTNDYWVRVNESEGRYTLSCRYDSGNQVIDALKTLFEAQHTKQVAKPKK